VTSWASDPAKTSVCAPAFRFVSRRQTDRSSQKGAGVLVQRTTKGWSKRPGRWATSESGPAQYLSLDIDGSWAELIRARDLTDPGLFPLQAVDMWQVHVCEQDVADLSTFDALHAAGIDPAIAVQRDYTPAQALGAELAASGFRGMLSPSAALLGGVNLTLFGGRNSRCYPTLPPYWDDPDREDRHIPVVKLAHGAPPPIELLDRVVFRDSPHPGLEAWHSGATQAR